ncbi:MAG: hypothetical protein GY841_10400 [FCB group bacterium]|nr:hypothetical protein [FCB group bacterium]
MAEWVNGVSVSAEINTNVGDITDAGSLAADTSSVVALARKGAKEAWETEHHFHNVERWFGDGGIASKVPFAIACADDDWGAWTTIMEPGDTPVKSGATHFDAHRIFWEDVDAQVDLKPTRYQIAWSTASDGEAAAVLAGDYTEIIESPQNNARADPTAIIMKRLATGTYYLFMRQWIMGIDADGEDPTHIFYGIHEYTDPDV